MLSGNVSHIIERVTFFFTIYVHKYYDYQNASQKMLQTRVYFSLEVSCYRLSEFKTQAI